MKKILILLMFVQLFSVQLFSQQYREIRRFTSNPSPSITPNKLYMSDSPPPTGSTYYTITRNGVNTYWSTGSISGWNGSHFAHKNDWTNILLPPTTSPSWFNSQVFTPTAVNYTGVFITNGTLSSTADLFNDLLFASDNGSLTILYQGDDGGNVYVFSLMYTDIGFTTSDPYPYVPHIVYDVSLLDNAQFTEQVFSVYPNPTQSILNIDTEQEFSASLYDLSGNLLLTSTLKTLDLSSLSSGIYILNIISDDRRYTRKIVKN